MSQPLYGSDDDHDVASWGAFAQYMEDFNKVYADRKGMLLTRYEIHYKNHNTCTVHRKTVIKK